MLLSLCPSTSRPSHDSEAGHWWVSLCCYLDVPEWPAGVDKEEVERPRASSGAKGQCLGARICNPGPRRRTQKTTSLVCRELNFHLSPEWGFHVSKGCMSLLTNMKALWAEKDITSNLEDQCSPQMVLVPDVRERELQNEEHPRCQSWKSPQDNVSHLGAKIQPNKQTNKYKGPVRNSLVVVSIPAWHPTFPPPSPLITSLSHLPRCPVL